jgi:hypothetical protein
VGLGRRTFAPGEVLTASNVMNYLQDQAVMNFAGTAARGSAIGTALSEGMVSYMNDTDNLEVYRAIGTAAPGWNPVAFRSEVESLPVSGLVPIVPTTVTVASGSATTNTLGRVTFTGSTSVSLDGVFTSSYANYKIIIKFSGNTDNTGLNMRWRAAGSDITASNYFSGGWYGNAASNANGYWSWSNAAQMDIGRSINITDQRCLAILDVLDPQETKTTSHSLQWFGQNAGGPLGGLTNGMYGATTSMNGFKIYPGAGNITGTVQVFGYND